MSTYQETEKLKAWIWVLAIAAAISAFGWYSASSRSDMNSTISTSSNSSLSNDNITLSKIDEFRDALYESNEAIDRMNNCIDSSHDAFEAGEFDDGISELENCAGETADVPSLN